MTFKPTPQQQQTLNHLSSGADLPPNHRIQSAPKTPFREGKNIAWHRYVEGPGPDTGYQIFRITPDGVATRL